MENIFGRFVLSIFPDVVKNYFRSSFEAKTIAVALYGEISAALEIALSKQNMEFLDALEKRAEKNDFSPYYISFKSEYFSVYSENAHQLGKLKPPNPELISKFYISSKAILDEHSAINTFIEEGRVGEEITRGIKNLNELFRETARLGHRCCASLKHDYKIKS